MASSSNAERDTTLLHVGKQCSHDHCLLVDFLPFKCQHCQLDFCQEHFKVDVHKCPKYDEAKFNRVAPNCPLCNTPVASKPGQDPNIRMDQHLERECTVVTGRVKTSTMPLCARGTCKKVLFSPIRCDTCRKQYCISHRFPADHTCVPTSQGAPARRPIPARKATTNTNIDTSKALNNLNTEVKKLNVKASVAVDNVKKQVAATTASSNAAINSLPFSKMERSSTVPVSATSSTTDESNDTTPPTTSPTNPFNRPTTNATPNANVTNIKTKPEPVISAMSFIPRSIFATA